MLRKICILITALIGGFSFKSMSHGFSTRFVNEKLILQADTVEEEEITEAELEKFQSLRKINGLIDTVDVSKAKVKPYTNLADFLKGQVAGAYVQQPSGESGTMQNVIIRGAGIPLFDNKSLNSVRPAVFVNGIPMTGIHNFAYNAQTYEFNRIGPETDYFNFVDISAIKHIEVVKDPAKLALLGPLAANGAILITTFGGESGKRELSVNSYFGISQKPSNVTPVNAHYENLFRQPFYSLYNNSLEARQVYPGFLADSTNLNYYGASKWNDEYYRNATQYSFDMSLRGGTDRANFGFLGGHTKNSSTADKNNFDRYNILLNINMLPFRWFTVSAYINGTRTERDRNRNLRDRYAEMGYLPDLATPLAPNVNLYRSYLSNYERAVDDNITNALQGNIALSFDILRNLNYTTSFMVDYNEGIRDVFYPSELMETINYVSNYYGYSQRYIFANRVKFDQELNDRNKLSFIGGVEYMDDLYRYNYGKAYDGPNDFIKINVVSGNPQDAYLQPQGGLKVYRWYNTEYNRLFSAYGKFGYEFNSVLDLNAVLRWDGSSTVQPDSRWLFTPSASASWNIGKQLEQEEDFTLKIAAGRVGRIQMDSRFAVGPQYAPNLRWGNETNVMSYYGNAGISRPYNSGWVGYDLGWAYVDQLDVTLNKSFLDKRIIASLSLYQKEDKNQIALIPVPQEYGYVGQFKEGLAIRNRGVDLSVLARVVDKGDLFQWNTALNLNLNKNKVTALPDNLKQLAVGDRLLKVGESADAFWVYENTGIYASDAEVPVSNGQRLSNEGIEFAYGDPKWKDNNNDFEIDSYDKVLKGNALPKVFGGFNNQFKYKNFDLKVDLTFALGQKALNQRAANKYNFINLESNNSISSVREIFHWQQDVDISKYPLYNPWSSVDPYRIDQDLFLENASYLKIRNISLGYQLTDAAFLQGVKSMRKAYVFATVSNLHTFTNFSGLDPELVQVNGYYDGYGLPLTPTYTIGFKLDL